jgi:uncharacterized protein YndB with AHSA1/START domain
MTISKGSAVLTLPKDNQIEFTRQFSAPPHMVFRVFTEPALIRRWWAGQQGTVTSAEVDLHVGGAWRFAMTAHAGFEVAFRGVYKEIVPGRRIVCTEIYETGPGASNEEPGALCTYTFTPSATGTTLSLVTEVPDQETRDMILASGMESGVQDGWDIAEELAAELADTAQETGA